MKWESFNKIQDKAIPIIMNTEKDVVLSAGTASGKTEAAFLPILTKIEATASQSLKVLYVSPLKALINNQFERIDKLCEYMDVKIHRWHGDVSQSKKQTFLKSPSGILQITPESIESLFINRPGSLRTLFQDLQFIVIDEIHSFIDRERGVQLRSLLSRIGEHTEKRARMVGLSATIDQFDLVKRWVDFQAPENVAVLEDKGSNKTPYHHLMYFGTDGSFKKPLALYKDMRQLTREQKAIIFCNSRGEVEEATVSLNRLAERERAGESYYPHHSSIDKKEREHVEKVMHETNVDKSIVATSSLELGIDIGNVDLVIQLDSTFSVSSLKQRLGRSGRKKEANPILQLYATERDSLLKSVAVMELLLDKWIEPATGYPVPYDIAFHQLLSICSEKNGVTKPQLVLLIKENHIFYSLDVRKIDLLIEYMIEHELLERLKGRGECIVGFKGEHLLRSKDFYSVFMTNEEYEVMEGIRKIGSIDKTPFVYEGDNIILSGKLWTIHSLDKKKNKAYVKKAVNAKPPKFRSASGKLHKKIGEKMFEILCSDDGYEYLDEQADDMLYDIRKPYHFNEINRHERVLWKEKKEYTFESFTSTEITTTLYWMMKILGVNVWSRDPLGRIKFEYEGTPTELLRNLLHFTWSESVILQAKKEKEEFVTKFSGYLPEQLKDEMHGEHELDIKGTIEYLKEYEWKVVTTNF